MFNMLHFDFCLDYPPEKLKEGLTGVLNNFSYHMGWGRIAYRIEFCIPHALHAACKMEVRMIPSCAICMIALPVSKQRHSLNPAASASNKTVVEY